MMRETEKQGRRVEEKHEPAASRMCPGLSSGPGSFRCPASLGPAPEREIRNIKTA